MINELRIRVPAKVMLCGEYAVLQQGESLAFTLARYMELVAKRCGDASIQLESDLWQHPICWNFGEEVPSLGKAEPLVQLVAACSKNFSLSGFSLKVKSGWAISDGFGSSSALRLGASLALAVLANPSLLHALRSEPASRDRFWLYVKQAFEDQKREQGFASGYDIVTQFLGGLVSFAYTSSQWPAYAYSHPPLQKPLASFVHIYLGGQGAPTQSVGAKTLAWLGEGKAQKRFEQLKALSQALRDTFLAYMQTSWGDDGEQKKALLQAVRAHRLFFQQGPCFPQPIAKLLQEVEGLDQSWSYKTSGAGGEDALLVFALQEQLSKIDRQLNSYGWTKFMGSYPASGTLLEAL